MKNLFSSIGSIFKQKKVNNSDFNQTIPSVNSSNLNTYNTYNSDYERILNDCYTLLNISTSISTVLSRFILAQTYFDKISTQRQDEYLSLLIKAIDKCYSNTITQANNLKTEKAKQARFEKLENTINEHKNDLPIEVISHYESLKNTSSYNISNQVSKPTNEIADYSITSIITCDVADIRRLVSNIDKDLISLLWFYDGTFKNIKSNEPSAISIKLEVAETKTIEDLGYYPSYEQMSPEQRFIYLNWLHDVSNPIPTGYVFVLYYGLERHLIYGDYQKASNIIKKLRKYHTNSSFQSHSADALTMCAIKNKDFSLIADIDVDLLSPHLCAMLKMAKGDGFTSDDVIKFARIVGFTNHRYIKSDPALFNEILARNINGLFKLNAGHVNSIQADFTMVIANYCLNQDTRIYTLPDILTSTTLVNELFTVLQATHDEIKHNKKGSKTNKSTTETTKQSVQVSPNSNPEFYNKKLHIYPIEYGTTSPSKLYAANDNEKYFFKCLSEKLTPNQNALISLTRMANGTISVSYKSYPIGKITLLGVSNDMQLLKGMHGVSYANGDVHELVNNIDVWIRYIKYLNR